MNSVFPASFASRPLPRGKECNKEGYTLTKAKDKPITFPREKDVNITYEYINTSRHINKYKHHINTRANTYTPAGVCVYIVVRKIYFSKYNRYTKKSSVNCCRSGGDNDAASRIRGRPPRTSGRRLSPRPSVELTAYVATTLIPSHFFTCLNSLLITVHCFHFAHFICDIRYIFFVCFQSVSSLSYGIFFVL